MEKIMKGLDEVMRLKRMHTRWVRIQALLGILPVFAIINRFHPMITDGYGNDLLPTLLPEPVAEHYLAILAAALAVLAVSELLRRRFHSKHKDDLAL
jgi:hypothetical protein